MPISHSGKPYFTPEQYDYARYSTSALEYAKAQGYDLVETSKYAYLKEHDSMVFAKNGQWFWNSMNLKGGALDFMMAYEGRSLIESVLILNGETIQNENGLINDTPRSPAKIADFSKKDNDIEDAKEPFKLPPRAENNKRLYAYLVHHRGISKKVIDTMIDNGILYQSAETLKDSNKTISNCVFVTYDQDHVPVSAFKRGASQRSTFKMEVPGSQKSTPFSLPASSTSPVLAIFEASIDAASHASLYEMMGIDNPFQIHRIATGGTPHMEGIEEYLKNHPDIKEIWLGQDMDQAGEKQRESITKWLKEHNYNLKIKSIHPLCNCKDWNDSLQVWRKAVNESVQKQLQSHRKAAPYRVHLLNLDHSIAQSFDFQSKKELSDFLKTHSLGQHFAVETPDSYHTAMTELSWDSKKEVSKSYPQQLSEESDLSS